MNTDNCSEFKKYFKIFLDENKINKRYGAPKKLTSQGCIERFNRTIQESLEQAYRIIQIKSDFDLKFQVDEFFKLYNYKWIHSTTRKIP